MSENYQEQYQKAMGILKYDSSATLDQISDLSLRAVEILTPLAEGGYAPAQVKLAWQLKFGLHLMFTDIEIQNQNNEKSFYWYKKAAEQGYAPGQKSLGLELIHEKNNPKEGLQWLLKAADQKDIDAYFFIGQYYYNGWGNDKDLNKAKEWYLLAATGNHHWAQFVLGEIFELEGDKKQAFEYYFQASNKNHTDSLRAVARFYEEGIYVLQNYKEALKVYTTINTKSPDSMAMYKIGYFSELGLGCDKNIKESKIWYAKAKEILADIKSDRSLKLLKEVNEALMRVDSQLG